jgi:hypothetical protein
VSFPNFSSEIVALLLELLPAANGLFNIRAGPIPLDYVAIFAP